MVSYCSQSQEKVLIPSRNSLVMILLSVGKAPIALALFRAFQALNSRTSQIMLNSEHHLLLESSTTSNPIFLLN